MIYKAYISGKFKSNFVDKVYLESDFLIAGSGVAGLSAALEAAEANTVILLNKSNRKESSSYWAQGGVAAVLKSPDSLQSHIEDTLHAGRYYGNKHAVELLVREGSEKVKEIISLGMQFDRSGSEFDLGLEGGHSSRRILHASGAATGKALVDFLYKLASDHDNIRIIENTFVYDLIRDDDSGECIGAKCFSYNIKETIQILSDATILATGGYSGLYSRTTNPHTSTGDGLWLAYRQGAVLKDLEFVQFHPTAFHCSEGKSFLISEALRGEGARLYNQNGERFMLKYDQKELAPRDVVSREIYRQIKNQKEDFVYLHVDHLNVEELKMKFPGLISKIEEHGVNVEKEGIPVSPAAHYCIGGIENDMDGRTAFKRLFAVGELAATGVHGANRLASNSLLECLVFSRRAVKNAKKLSPVKKRVIPFDALKINPDKKHLFNKINSEIVALLNLKVGIERNKTDLDYAQKTIEEYRNENRLFETGEYYSTRLKGALIVAGLIAKSASVRSESLGVHTRTDSVVEHGGGNGPIRFQREAIKKPMKQVV